MGRLEMRWSQGAPGAALSMRMRVRPGDGPTPAAYGRTASEGNHMPTLTDRQFERAANMAYTAVVQAEGEDNKRDLLRALKRNILHALADMVYVEHEGRRDDSIIDEVLTEL